MTFRPINADDQRMIAAARKALKRAYLPGKHTVGVAVKGPSGKTYVGVNVEACGYGPCAEPIAIGALFTAGEREIRKIVAVHHDGDGSMPVLSPCGNCRQLVFDYSPDAEVIVALDGRIVKALARDLLPAAYESHLGE